MAEDHVHDCTGPDGRCACGWKPTVSRFAVSFDVFDNSTKKSVVDDAFMTDSAEVVAEALEEAANQIRRIL